MEIDISTRVPAGAAENERGGTSRLAHATSGNAKRHAPAEWTDFEHTGPGTLAGRYLRRFWQPVSRGEDLPAGRAKPIRIMGEDLTLYRGERPHPSPLPEEEGNAG